MNCQVLLDYVIEEVLSHGEGEYSSVIESRMMLLLRLCGNNREKLRVVIDHLYTKLKQNE